jgi:adenosylhomocysteine nucleosidase
MRAGLADLGSEVHHGLCTQRDQFGGSARERAESGEQDSMAREYGNAKMEDLLSLLVKRRDLYELVRDFDILAYNLSMRSMGACASGSETGALEKSRTTCLDKAAHILGSDSQEYGEIVAVVERVRPEGSRLLRAKAGDSRAPDREVTSVVRRIVEALDRALDEQLEGIPSGIDKGRGFLAASITGFKGVGPASLYEAVLLLGKDSVQAKVLGILRLWRSRQSKYRAEPMHAPPFWGGTAHHGLSDNLSYYAFGKGFHLDDFSDSWREIEEIAASAVLRLDDCAGPRGFQDPQACQVLGIAVPLWEISRFPGLVERIRDALNTSMRRVAEAQCQTNGAWYGGGYSSDPRLDCLTTALAACSIVAIGGDGYEDTVRKAVDFLRGSQLEHGCWPSWVAPQGTREDPDDAALLDSNYMDDTRLFTAIVAVELIQRVDGDAASATVELAQQWIIDQQEVDGSWPCIMDETFSDPVRTTMHAIRVLDGRWLNRMGTDATTPVQSQTAAIGVITITREETVAVQKWLKGKEDYRDDFDLPSGRYYSSATIELGTISLRVTATQATRQGQASAQNVCRDIVSRTHPRLLVLLGIAGGIRTDVALGDVVFATDIIDYSEGSEVDSGIKHRGYSHPVPAWSMNTVNQFMVSLGTEPVMGTRRKLPNQTGRFRVLMGPIGTGPDVIKTELSDVRKWLATVNYQTMAVETEAGGVASFFHEWSAQDTGPSKTEYLVIRGISDHATSEKDDKWHIAASSNAVQVLGQLLEHSARVLVGVR